MAIGPGPKYSQRQLWTYLIHLRNTGLADLLQNTPKAGSGPIYLTFETLFLLTYLRRIRWQSSERARRCTHNLTLWRDHGHHSGNKTGFPEPLRDLFT